MRNGETGARRLDLPIVDVAAGSTPIDLIRRPRAGHPIGPGTPFEERFFRPSASVRVLHVGHRGRDHQISRLVTATPPVDLGDAHRQCGFYTCAPSPIGTAAAAGYAGLSAGTRARPPASSRLSASRRGGVWDDVTIRVLNLGIAGRDLSNGAANTVGHQPAAPNEPFSGRDHSACSGSVTRPLPGTMSA